jgi:outer membrane protein TolC
MRIDRGLRNNLGVLLSGQASEMARAERMRSLSTLLPQVTGAVSENVEQTDLKTKGIDFHLPGGFSTPTIISPFDYTDTRAYASFSVFDYSLRRNHRAAKEGERAAQLSLKDARDLVVQSVANAYLLVIAGSSRVQALRAQVVTDQAIYERTSDQKRAGTTAAIDVLRARVELQQEQQQLIAQQNQVAKDKLALGRVIGLPLGQQFTIADTAPYSSLAAMTPDQALHTAYEQRADFQSAKASVRAAENSVSAARGERYPSLGVTADYGAVGTTLDSSHGTFTFQAVAKFNIFDGGRISSDVVQARAALKQRQDELADLGGQIDYQVRAALLDIESAAEQVAVARNNLDLSNQTLTQARDRFTSGVTDTIEVVQAQGSVAVANDNLISALYAHNLSKVELARALGASEERIQRFMEVK